MTELTSKVLDTVKAHTGLDSIPHNLILELTETLEKIEISNNAAFDSYDYVRLIFNSRHGDISDTIEIISAFKAGTVPTDPSLTIATMISQQYNFVMEEHYEELRTNEEFWVSCDTVLDGFMLANMTKSQFLSEADINTSNPANNLELIAITPLAA